jgi:acetyl-CoA C-acetyltransferase
MNRNLAVVGVGVSGFSPLTPDLSFREVIYEAAVKAYSDAGLEHHQIDGFVTTAEDMMEGYSIADEYTPDQIGGVLKPCYTVPGDFLHSIGSAVMMIQSGLFDVVAVQCLSKASNMLTLPDLAVMAMDPALNRPLKFSENVVAALEMNRFLMETGNTIEQCAQVVANNRASAMLNPHAGFGAKVTVDDILNSDPVAFPLTELSVAQTSDGAVVVVLAAEEVLNKLSGKPVFIKGVGWSSDAPSLESRNWGEAEYAVNAAKMAYKQAGIVCPENAIDIVEVNDEYGYKQLMHLEAMGLCQRGASGDLLDAGFFSSQGDLPTNISGGMMGVGNLFEANGGSMLLELVTQLRSEAGKRQIADVKTGMAMAWRGVPSSSGAAVILTNEG